jgi:hypothetical protein
MTGHLRLAGAIVLVLVMAAIGYVVDARYTAPPAGSAEAAGQFLDAWNRHDYAATHAHLATSIDRDVFVGALGSTAAPITDLRLDRVTKLNDQQVSATYSGNVPDATYAVAAVVFANRLRYPDACSRQNAGQTAVHRVSDILNLQRDDAGAWRVGFRGDTDFLQGGARLLAVSFDLSPRFIWGHVTADADPKSDRYDQLVAAEALATYQRDLGPGGSGPETTPLATHLAQLRATCATASG